MALAPNTAYGLLNPGTTTPSKPTTYADAGVTPTGPISSGGGPTTIGHPGPPVFNPGPSLPNVPGATYFTYTPGADPFSYGGGAAPTPTPPAAPGGAPGGSGGAGGGTTDPSVLASLGLEQQGLGQLDAALKSARERAIIGFGDPSLASEAGFGLDPQAGAFAQQNYLSGNSTLSRLDKQHNLAHQAVINQLASHGILNSGDLGYQEGQADQTYGNQVYDAKQQVLDYLSSLLSNYNTQQQQLKQSTIQARQNAIANFLSNPTAYTQAFGG